MASKGWILLLLMVGVLAVTLAFGSLGSHPKKTVQLSPQGSAIIVASVPELLNLPEPATDLFPVPPLLGFSPAYTSSSSHAAFSRPRLRRGVLHTNGHIINSDYQNEMASRVCNFDS